MITHCAFSQNVTVEKGIGIQNISHSQVHISTSQRRGFICNLGSSSIGDFHYQKRASRDGRDYMELIKSYLEKNVTNICGLNLKGMGGVGKSTLAYQYAREHVNNSYKLIWFFPCENDVNHFEGAKKDAKTTYSSAFEQSLKLLYTRLFPDHIAETLDIETIKASVYNTLHEYEDKILLIYDNVEDQKSLNSLLVKNISKQMHVIITSRRILRGDNKLDIDVFHEDEAIQCLEKEIKWCNPYYGYDLKKEQIKAIVLLLDCLPLAVVQAAAYIASEDIDLNEFINRFHELDKHVVEYDDDKQAIPHSFYQMFSMSLDVLSEEEKEMLFMLSYLTPNDIVSVFFEEKDKILKKLQARSLIKYAHGYISIHRLLQMVGRDYSKDERERYIDRILSTFDRYFDNDLAVTSLEYFNVLLNIQQQLNVLRTYAKQEKVYYLFKYSNDCLLDILFDILGKDIENKVNYDNFIAKYIGVSEQKFEHLKNKFESVLVCFSDKRDQLDVLSFGINVKEDDVTALISFFLKMKNESSSSKELLYNFFALCSTEKDKWEEKYKKSRNGFLWGMSDKKYNINHESATLVSYPMFEYKYGVKFFDFIKKDAYKNDPIAQSFLGLLYWNGFIVKNYKKAIYWWEKAAAQNNDFAQCYLGNAHSKGFDIDQKKAVYWWEKAAENGNVEAKCNLGIAYATGEGVDVNHQKAIDLWTDASRRGDLKSLFNLGLAYDNGRGVKKDRQKALCLWEEAAIKNDPDSQFNLANAYDTGNGVEINQKKAAYWWEKAAENGHPKSQFNLGCAYTNGNGVEFDRKKAIYWWEKAAEQGDSKAQFNLGCAYMNGNGIEKNIEKGLEYWRRAAEQGHREAQFNLALSYKIGRGVNQDKKEAFYWWKKAAEQGDSNAQLNVGLSFAKGDGVDIDLQQSVYWWKKAAEQGDSDAQFRLGGSYFIGSGVEQSYLEANKWLNLSAKQGNLDAQEILKKWSFLSNEILQFNQTKNAGIKRPNDLQNQSCSNDDSNSPIHLTQFVYTYQPMQWCVVYQYLLSYAALPMLQFAAAYYLHRLTDWNLHFEMWRYKMYIFKGPFFILKNRQKSIVYNCIKRFIK